MIVGKIVVEFGEIKILLDNSWVFLKQPVMKIEIYDDIENFTNKW